MMGWTCPNCGRGCAPHVDFCCSPTSVTTEPLVPGTLFPGVVHNCVEGTNGRCTICGLPYTGSLRAT